MKVLVVSMALCLCSAYAEVEKYQSDLEGGDGQKFLVC